MRDGLGGRPAAMRKWRRLAEILDLDLDLDLLGSVGRLRMGRGRGCDTTA